jgi:hypothetical protein
MRNAFHSHEPGAEVQHFAGNARHRGLSNLRYRATTADATGIVVSRRCQYAAAIRASVVRTLISAAALLLLLAPASVRCQEIWIGLRSPDYHATAARDWGELFKPTPDWEQLAGQIRVFFIGGGPFLLLPDDQLKAMAADLIRRHIALGVPLNSVATRPHEPCDRTEGYGDLSFVTRFISRLTQLGIRLQIIRLDGPLWFGHYVDCKLPVAELAPRVAETLRPMLQAFPDAVVGDVMPPVGLAQFPDWQANYLAFKRDLEAAVGHKLTFMHADVNWPQPDWPPAVAALARLAHGSGMKFGVIYNSGTQAPTDAAWVADAKRHFDELESLYGLIPEQAVFQTWTPRPTQIFPETSESAQSYLVAQYRLPRTHLTAQHSAAGVQGRLTQVNGPAVSGARIAIETLGDDPDRPPPVRSVSGTVPPQARFAILALRVNLECFCSGANDLLLGPLSYQETAGGSGHYEYRYATPPRSEAGLDITPTMVANQPLMRLKLAPSRDFGFNSPAFPVTPGAQFQFQVPLGSLNGDGLFGTAAVIWLDAQHKGIKREYIHVGNDATPIAQAVTDASGNFAAALPANIHWRQRPLLLHYAGSATLRAAYAAAP